MATKQLRHVRFDSNRVRLKTGETEKTTGGYEYRWTTREGKRKSIYAHTLERLREMELELEIDKRDKIKADVHTLTVNDCFRLWKELKRGIKDSTFKNYIYMYEMFVMPTFGKKRITQIQKSDVGHCDISTTMDIYVDVMNDTKKKELANFDGFMASARA